jgi:hypothetical protein
VGGFGRDGVPVTGSGSEGEARVGVTRSASKPAPASPLALTSRSDKGRNPTRVGPPGDRGAHHRPAPAKGQVQRTGHVAKARCAGVDSTAGESRRSGDHAELREGFGGQPASRGAGSGRRFDVTASSRSSVGCPLTRESGAKGREARGAAEEGARARRSVQQTPGRVWGRGWRLAHSSALEALGELGRRLTVMRGVL